ncbi:hypothetical protein CK203_027824 [Vitis vinifera]|uniref:Uncharacterized protein n=1 Tax=Vitis vinifera TaxID=29760 RepID=A0A438J3H4_VITVI|nr:hypothetical protein CK203_115771 [Vitis vinifera]RVX03514.1 hypothetical protein CK203_027824 [Vitis vinifera]
MGQPEALASSKLSGRLNHGFYSTSYSDFLSGRFGEHFNDKMILLPTDMHCQPVPNNTPQLHIFDLLHDGLCSETTMPLEPCWKLVYLGKSLHFPSSKFPNLWPE